MLEALTLLMEHFPVYGLFAMLLVGIFVMARYLRSSEMRDMRSRIDYLDGQVKSLRTRDECYFDFVLYTERHYNRLELLAARKGWELDPRMSFMEFRTKWMKDRGLQDEWEEIWK